jgi:hypothetical protein
MFRLHQHVQIYGTPCFFEGFAGSPLLGASEGLAVYTFPEMVTSYSRHWKSMFVKDWDGNAVPWRIIRRGSGQSRIVLPCTSLHANPMRTVTTWTRHRGEHSSPLRRILQGPVLCVKEDPGFLYWSDASERRKEGEYQNRYGESDSGALGAGFAISGLAGTNRFATLSLSKLKQSFAGVVTCLHRTGKGEVLEWQGAKSELIEP